MKKYSIVILFLITSFGLPAQSPQYYNGGDWRDAPAGGGSVIAGGGPSSTTGGTDFVIETSGYDVTSSVVTRDFTVNDGGIFTNIYFLVHNTINISGKFNIKNDNGGSGAACAVYAGGFLKSSNQVIASEIKRPIHYDASSAKVSVYMVSGLLYSIVPGTSGGILELNSSGFEYDFAGSNLILDNIRIINVNESDITIKAQSLSINSNKTISEDDLEFRINDDITISEDIKLTLDATGYVLHVVNTGHSVIVKPGASIITNNNSGTINRLDIQSSTSKQGILLGTGVACTDVKMSVYVHDNTVNHVNGGADAYREIGIPFHKTVNSIDWGTFDSNIETSNSFYRHSFNNSTAIFSNSNPSDYVDSPQEVWLKGGSDYVVVTGGSLADKHNSGYSQALYNVADKNGNSGYNMLYNPFLSYFDVFSFMGDNGRRGSVKEVVWVMTSDGSAAADYKYTDVYGVGGANIGWVDYLGPYQAFWVEYNNSGGTIPLLTSYQSNGVGGEGKIDLQKKEDNAVRVQPDNIKIGIVDDEGTGEVYNNILMYSINDASGIGNTDGSRDVQNINAGSANSSLALYMDVNSKKLIYKEFLPSEVTANPFNQGFRVIGGVTKNLKVEISNNYLDAGYNVYLTDVDKGITVNLNDGPYPFTHTAITDADDFPDYDRFVIQITTETLGDSEKIEASSIKLINKGNTVEFAMPSTSSIEGVQFVSVNGQVAKTMQANKGQTEFDISSLSKGIYIAQLKLESGNVASFKFVR